MRGTGLRRNLAVPSTDLSGDLRLEQLTTDQRDRLPNEIVTTPVTHLRDDISARFESPRQATQPLQSGLAHITNARRRGSANGSANADRHLRVARIQPIDMKRLTACAMALHGRSEASWTGESGCA